MLRFSYYRCDDHELWNLGGSLSGQWVDELRSIWRRIRGHNRRVGAVVDLKQVTFIDESGKQLLAEMKSVGADIVGSGVEDDRRIGRRPEGPRVRPLQYFIHHDFDALRMELSGSLAGDAAQQATDAWWRETRMRRRQPLVIDVTYVTDTDELGKAALRAWQADGARLVASSSPARSIVNRSGAPRLRITSTGGPCLIA